MSGGKGEKSETSTQKVEVPEYLEKELKYGLSEARRLYDEGSPEYFPDQTYADFTPEQIEALQGTAMRARDGSPLISSAQDYTQRVIDGEFLENPYLDDLMARYGAKANQEVMGRFNSSNRLGSNSNVATGIQAVSDATLPYLFQSYQSERAMQDNASRFAPTLADYDYKDLASLSSVGDVYQAQEQMAIDDAMARYEYDMMDDDNWLDQYLSRVNASGANALTTTTNTKTSKSGGGLGQALGTALSIGSMFVPGGQFAALGTSIGSGMSSVLGNGMGQAVGGMMSSSPTGPYLPFGMSDIRMKENITPVGYKNGFLLYEFNYKGNDKKFIGPMAQDVEKVMPEAVKEFDGIKYVNQDMIGINISEVH